MVILSFSLPFKWRVILSFSLPFKGRVGVGMGLCFPYRPPNPFLYRFDFLKNLIVPKSYNSEPRSHQLVGTVVIVFKLLGMLSTIYLNNQFVL